MGLNPRESDDSVARFHDVRTCRRLPAHFNHSLPQESLSSTVWAEAGLVDSVTSVALKGPDWRCDASPKSSPAAPETCARALRSLCRSTSVVCRSTSPSAAAPETCAAAPLSSAAAPVASFVTQNDLQQQQQQQQHHKPLQQQQQRLSKLKTIC